MLGLLIGSLVLSGMALPTEAGGWHNRQNHGHGPGQFLVGFLAVAVMALVLDALLPRPVVREPRYYYKGMICQDVQVPGRWELEGRREDGSYRIWRPGYWRRECY